MADATRLMLATRRMAVASSFGMRSPLGWKTKRASHERWRMAGLGQAQARRTSAGTLCRNDFTRKNERLHDPAIEHNGR